MDKGSIIGGLVDELGEAVKGGAKTAVEQATGTGEYKTPKTQTPDEAQLKEMQRKEKEETSKELAKVRAKKSGLQVMEETHRPQELRPRERAEQQKQEELQAQEEKAAKKPGPLPPPRQGTREKLLGVSG